MIAGITQTPRPFGWGVLFVVCRGYGGVDDDGALDRVSCESGGVDTR